MIKLRDIIKEIKDEPEEINIQRIIQGGTYLDDVAESLGYNEDFNKHFWNFLYREHLYHCTKRENIPLIQQRGLLRKDNTRGIYNRSVGSAIFAVPGDYVEYYRNYYGPVCIRINTTQMKSDGYMPEVGREPEWEEAEKISFVLNKLGHKKHGHEHEAAEFVDSSGGAGQETIIFYGNIPPKYLSFEENLNEIEGYDPEMELGAKVKRLELNLKDKYPQLEDLAIYLRSAGDIYLNSLRVEKSSRGKGIGRKVMEEIIAFADEHDLYLTLHPSAEPRYKAKLFKFYKNFGLRPNWGRRTMYQFSSPFHRTMVRRPASKNYDAS